MLSIALESLVSLTCEEDCGVEADDRWSPSSPNGHGRFNGDGDGDGEGTDACSFLGNGCIVAEQMHCERDR